MMATVPHVTSGWGRRKLQADGFLLTRVYVWSFVKYKILCKCRNMKISFKFSPNLSLRFKITIPASVL